ncbi:methylated-DNA--[protein]-cysteine S-methyltransferase [Bittarella massiliensis (ex Durand et al. 2017)]|uniref:methylated-DNA--[protein]-cysteine S-methyltransferase n=1 Tax=Bittarella massiliensis (ex Durand et al. 2017) TaxID=1720313 RepID=UPI001AA14C74|nr:methylated-DNA--[protein]-cysteine S-methyltransferase [Bittarella massiliensis (ex Durand et al. 2017)]MBO1679445.1 methylated-DNA--[protein]-cysteine S-methyltransferase [Bittarella massiliensis (ex Durand et al. 2017)]
MKTICWRESPIGPLGVGEEDGAITLILFAGQQPPEGYREGETPLLREAWEQLERYFAGELRQFSLPLAPAGTPFQQAVWRALEEIPYGETCSYGEIARRVGRPQASRAVGGANHRNPIPIVIPCHRVIGAGGTLTGYGGGLDRKGLLLDLERENRPPKG